jgi:hypothetical protein
MKHIVTLTISNPAHEHISLRRRQSTTNYMVEARDEAEAIFRASNHFKKLGNYVHNAVIAESTLNEEVEQIDEAVKVGPANHDKSTDTVWHGVHHDGKEIGTIGTNSAQHVEKHGKWGFEDSRGYGRRHGEPEMNSKEEALDALVNRHKEYAKKKANEEVEQIDELSSGLVRRYGGKAIRAHLTAKAKGDTATALKRAKGVNLASAKAFPDSYKPGEYGKAKVPATNEEVEQIDELKKSTLASYITKASRQSSGLYSLGKEFDDDKYKYAKKALKARTPKTKEQAKTDMETAGRLAKTFTRKAQNRTAGISRAAVKMAKEEVESIDEVNARHSPEAAQAVLTPTAKIVRAAVGKTARDKASTKKYARRVAKISPDYSKKDVMGSLKSMGEEVEHVVEKAPPGAKYERMVKHIKNQYSKDGTLTPQEKAIAYATAWKAKNAGK